MCGRLCLHNQEAVRELGGQLGLRCQDMDFSGLVERFNMAPTHRLPVIWDDGDRRQLSTMVWGWPTRRAVREGKTQRHINAKSETVYELPTFKKAARKHHCVIVANGFYEWRRDYQDRPLEPHYITTKQGGWMAIAAIYQFSAVGDDKETCLLTMPPNQVVAPIHHRMPCMLTLDGVQDWLQATTPAAGLEALQPIPEDLLQEWYVSELVNSVENDDPDLLLPVPPPPRQLDWI